MERPAAHQPVMQSEVLALLAPKGRRFFLDCTIGLGGHAEALLEQAGPEAVLIGIDMDESNCRLAYRRLKCFGPRVRVFHAGFDDAEHVLAEADVPSVDAVLADLGVASNQLDDPLRGLSFSVDGPLDMRMDRSVGRTAGQLVNELGQQELADLIYANGQERYSRRIARAIVAARRAAPIDGTAELARIVARAYPGPARRSRRGVHPATRTFMALRIAVNDELTRLEKLLEAMPRLLAPLGRAAVISFHSLEDRRVKTAFRDLAKTGQARVLTKKPLRPSQDEIDRNPRSRSAKLRGVERIP